MFSFRRLSVTFALSLAIVSTAAAQVRAGLSGFRQARRSSPGR